MLLTIVTVTVGCYLIRAWVGSSLPRPYTCNKVPLCPVKNGLRLMYIGHIVFWLAEGSKIMFSCDKSILK